MFDDGYRVRRPDTRTEGEMIVGHMDWVIIGIKGERYPCKRDIFEVTYERVDQ